MSESNGKAPTRPTLVIALGDGGTGVHVSGPINDRVLAYGMLGSAFEAVMKFHAEKAEGARVLLARGDMPPTA